MHSLHLPIKTRLSYTHCLTSNSFKPSTSPNRTCKHLFLIHYIPLTHLLTHPTSALSVDTTGDFLAFKLDFKANLIRQLHLCSLFNIRRAYGLPDIDFSSTSREVPNPPKLVSAGPTGLLSGAVSWFGGGGGMTGEQLDALCRVLLLNSN